MPYHGTTGFRNTDTSYDAARKANETAGGYRERTAAALDIYGPLTADEIAQALNVSILTIRPRVTNCGAPSGSNRPGCAARPQPARTPSSGVCPPPPSNPRTFAPVVTAGVRGTSPRRYLPSPGAFHRRTP